MSTNTEQAVPDTAGAEVLASFETEIQFGVYNDPSRVTVPVEVTRTGEFVARIGDDVYSNERLEGLKFNLKEGLHATRVDVPFVSYDGRRGVIRGYHSGTREALVTWEDGTKDKVAAYTRVWRPDEVSDEAVEEIERLRSTREQADRRLNELQVGGRKITEVLTEAIGSTISD